MPNAQGHIDVVVYKDASKIYTSAIHIGDFNEHQETHHKDDFEHNENSDHQHHTIIVNFVTEFIEVFNYNPIFMIETLVNSKPVVFYQNLHTSNFLDTLFQPPRVEL